MTLPTYGTAVLDELLESVHNLATLGDTVDTNPLVQTALVHGSGFLTGLASQLLFNVAQEPMTIRDREAELINAANLCLLTVIAGRIHSANETEGDETESGQLFPDLDEGPTGNRAFDDMVAQIFGPQTVVFRAA